MNKYHVLNKQTIIKTLTTLDQLSLDFPMLSVSQVNFYALAPHYGLKGKDFYCMVVFMDGMRKLKAQDHLHNKTASFVVNVNELHQLIVKKQEDRWVFEMVHGEEKNHLSFEHFFKF